MTVRESAYFKIVKGIARETNLTNAEIALILRVQLSDIDGWDATRRIPLHHTTRITGFVQLWRNLQSFAGEGTAANWLRSKNFGLGDKTPLQVIESNESGLAEINDLLSRLFNP